METTVKPHCSSPRVWLAALAMLVACDSYEVTMELLNCDPDACVRPPSGRAAQFRVQSYAPSEDGVVAMVNGRYADRIDRAGDAWLITARQSWAQLGDSVTVEVKGYSDCKIRCDRWHTAFEMTYAEHSWQVEALPQPVAPDAFAIAITGGKTVIVQREAMGQDGQTPWSVRGEFAFTVYPGAPWPMFVDAFGRPGVLDPDAFGRTEPTSLNRTALPHGLVLGRLHDGIYVVQDDRLLLASQDDVAELGPAPATTTVLAAQDSLWLVLREGSREDARATLQHIENGAELYLPDGPWPMMEWLRGPAHALVYERVIRTDDPDKPYSWQRYELHGEVFEAMAEVQGYMATVVPQGLGVLEVDFAAQAGRTAFGFAVGQDWFWVADGVASLVRSNYWGETKIAHWDDKVRDW